MWTFDKNLIHTFDGKRKSQTINENQRVSLGSSDILNITADIAVKMIRFLRLYFAGDVGDDTREVFMIIGFLSKCKFENSLIIFN